MGAKASSPTESIVNETIHYQKMESEEKRKKAEIESDEPENSMVDIPPPKFPEEQTKLVKESWVLVEDHISQIGLSMYLELFQRNPETITLFPFLKQLSKEDIEFYSQLKHHAIRVTGVITMLVRQLNKPMEESDRQISEFLLDLGRRHFGYGSSTHLMELMGVLFVDSLIRIFDKEPVKQVEIQEAWLAFFKLITFFMQEGFLFVQNKGNAAAAVT